MPHDPNAPREHSVVDGVLVKTSVSQITSFDHEQDGGCHRKWYFDKVLHIPQPEKAFLTLGTEIHAQNEHYTLTGEDVLSPIARPGKHLIFRHPLVEVEKEFKGSDLIAAGVPLIGYIDVYNPSGLYVDDSGEHEDPPDSVEIGDYKTTKSIDRYAKTGAALVKTIQMPSYAKFAHNLNPRAKWFRLSHIYLQTAGPKRAEKRTTLVPLSVVDARWSNIVLTVSKMREIAAVKKIEDVPYNDQACRSYGGCPYRNRCPLPASNSNLTMFGRPKPDSSTPTPGLPRMSLIRPRGPAVVPAAPDAPVPPPVAAVAPVVPATPPPVSAPVASAPATAPAASGGSLLRKTAAPATASASVATVIAAPAVVVPVAPAFVVPATPPVVTAPRQIPVTDAHQGYYGVESNWVRYVARTSDNTISFQSLSGQIVSVPVGGFITEAPVPAGLVEAFAALDARLAAPPPPPTPPQPVVVREPDAPLPPAALRPANAITPPDQPVNNPLKEALPIPESQVGELSDAVRAILRPENIQQPATPATAAPKAARGRPRKSAEAIAAPVAPAPVAVVPVAPAFDAGLTDNSAWKAVLNPPQAAVSTPAPAAPVFTVPPVNAAVQAVLNPPPATAVIAPVVPAPVQAHLPLARVAAIVSTIEPAKSAEKFLLYVNCMPTDPSSVKGLEGYREQICDRICKQYDVPDVRLGKEGTDLGFGRFKGLIAALCRENPPAFGAYFIDTRGSEINALIAETLIPLARLAVRGF